MTAPAAPPEAVQLFGDRLPLAERYAGFLAHAGLERGLIGPRELPLLWSRHLLNCANLGSLIAAEVRVVDVGSGAGLPGLVVALLRPDVRVDLVESLARRCLFLEEAVAMLGLGARVRVVRGRAEDKVTQSVVGGADVVTARAVAPLDRLVRWCLPLAATGGWLFAMKGAQAEDEIAAAAGAVRSAGGADVSVVWIGAGQSATRVVRVRRAGDGAAVPRREGSGHR